MKRSFWVIGMMVLVFSCDQREDKMYTGRQISHTLNQGNLSYAYQGEVVFKEMIDGATEVNVHLNGEMGSETYFLPSHLHFGAYNIPDASIAAVLYPVDLKTLSSTTVLGKLSNGQELHFGDLEDFDGHVKIHLAEDGPDYKIILAAGNIGRNSGAAEFNMDKVTLCSPNF